MSHLLSTTLRPTRLAVALLGLAIGACSAETVSQTPSLAGLDTPGLSVQPAEALNSSLGDYLAGNFALQTGHLAEAATYFGRAAIKDPDNLDLRRQLFLLNLASGGYDAALAEARQLAGIDLEVPEAELLLSLDDVRGGSFANAHDRLQALPTQGVAGLTVPFLDAWALFATGGDGAVDAGLARLGEGEALGPLNGYHRAMLLDLGGRLGDAATSLGDALPEAGPAPVRMLQAYASMLVRQDRPEAAVALIREQLAARGDQPVLADLLAALEAGETPPQPFTDAAGGMADALLGIAEALHQERGNRMAVVYARLAIFARPDLVEAALLIGDMMAEQDNLEAAIEAYQELGPDSPLYFAAQLRLARALHQIERQEEAFDLLGRLAEAEPQRVDALVQLGDLLRRDEEYGRAETAYSQAVGRIQEPRADHWTLFYARGITFERTERWPQAEEDFLYALELEPEQPFVLNYLGYSWVDMGMNLDQAKGMLERAVELRPDDGFIVDSLGWVHYRLGDYDAAVDSLERAVELEPGDPVINEHLGDAYWRVGRQREARFQWQRALSLEPEEDAIAGLEEKLRSGLPATDPERSRI